jgi:hypothetical protein
MNGARPAPVASLVPLLPEHTDDLARAPTRPARRAQRDLAQRRDAAKDPTKIERRGAPHARTKIDIDELPTLVVPPPVTLSSGARRRPHEIADDVASSFDISPFESFEGDVATIADIDDIDDIDDGDDDSREPALATGHRGELSVDESAFACMLPPMAEVWNQADAIVTEPVFAIDVATNSGVELIEAVEDHCGEDPSREGEPVDDARASRPRRLRWFAGATVAVATACCAIAFLVAFVVDERVAARTLAWSDHLVAIAHTKIVPELRQFEGRARWIAARSR